MHRIRGRRLPSVAAVAALCASLALLAGCTPQPGAGPSATAATGGAAAPAASPTTAAPASPAVPAPVPVPSAGSGDPADPAAPGTPPGVTSIPFVVIDAGELTVTTDSGSRSYGYSEGASPAITGLTALLGAPVTTYAAPGKCEAGSTTVAWPSLSLRYPGQDPAGTLEDFRVTARAVPVAGASGALVDVVTPHGARVGDSFAAYAPSVAGNDQLTGSTFDVVVDTVRDDVRTSYGVVVTAENGTISLIAAPADLNADC